MRLLLGVALVASMVATSATVNPQPAIAEPTTAVTADDFYTVRGDGRLLVANSAGVLANDMHEEGAMALTLGTGPLHQAGAWKLDGGGGFAYEPESGFVGFDTFTYCISLDLAAGCTSGSATVIIKGGDPVARRVAGVDRYEGAARISEETNPGDSSIVFVASGETFPDALGSAPVAANRGASLLLTEASRLSTPARDELRRLKPTVVVVVGGPRTVSEGVLSEIRDTIAVGSQVVRVSGRDRYEVSRILAADWMRSSTSAFVATGATFPDALAAGAVAGSKFWPIVLVDGSQMAVDAETQATLLNRNTSHVTIVGGPRSVSPAVEAGLSGIAAVERLSGPDRYDVAVNLARAKVTSARVAYLATGTNYPDALVGGVLAAKSAAPLYLVPGTCIPTAVLSDLARIGAREIVLLGGERSLSADVAAFKPC